MVPMHLLPATKPFSCTVNSPLSEMKSHTRWRTLHQWKPTNFPDTIFPRLKVELKIRTKKLKCNRCRTPSGWKVNREQKKSSVQNRSNNNNSGRWLWWRSWKDIRFSISAGMIVPLRERLHYIFHKLGTKHRAWSDLLPEKYVFVFIEHTVELLLQAAYVSWRA